MSDAILLLKHTDELTQYEGQSGLKISEIFTNTIQGEGIHSGHPAVFFRTMGCLNNCVWCDTREIWKNGNRVSFTYLITLLRNHAYTEFVRGAHLVVTGGSPLLQQDELAEFLHLLKQHYHKSTGLDLFIEIENEASIAPSERMIEVIDTWNNSPKLKNSLIARSQRFNVAALKRLAKIEDSWFKFVVRHEREWAEIEKEFLPHIPKEKILLMPMGVTDAELDKSLEMCIAISKEHGCEITDRQHIREGRR